MWNASISPPTDLVTNKKAYVHMNIKPISMTAALVLCRGDFGSHLPSWQVCGSQRPQGRTGDKHTGCFHQKTGRLAVKNLARD